MAEEKQELAQKQEFTTTLSEWTNTITGLVIRDFEQCGVMFDDYSKKCAMAAMGSIFQLVQGTEKTTMKDLNTSNLREIVEQCASLKLNANAVPREVYFQLRSKQINGEWKKVVEMGIEGDGNDALLRQFGSEIEKVYPVWIVKEGDDFTYPKRKGIEITPPEWNPKGLSDKTIQVVYPIKLTDGTVDYLVAEREPVRTNLIAHIRNNMLNETFGFVTGTKKDKYGKTVDRTRYDATSEEKEKIKAKKAEIMEAVRSCDTLDDILKCAAAIPYISAAWLDTPENMIIRKMRNNAIKKFPKNLNQIASSSLLQLDDTYKAAQEEITDNENSQEFVVEENVVADAEAVVVEEPDFAKEQGYENH